MYTTVKNLRKQMRQLSNKFAVGDSVVYPSHGVGEITAEETQVIAGVEMKLYVITFLSDKMILRVPISRALKTGLRHLCSNDDIIKVEKTLQSKPKIQQKMWSKRAQEYETKINSGDVILISEVLRDLHRNVDDSENSSYSEKVIFESALDRLAQEYAAATEMTKEKAKIHISDILTAANI